MEDAVLENSWSDDKASIDSESSGKGFKNSARSKFDKFLVLLIEQ